MIIDSFNNSCFLHVPDFLDAYYSLSDHFALPVKLWGYSNEEN
jgi:hypothetical protein